MRRTTGKPFPTKGAEKGWQPPKASNMKIFGAKPKESPTPASWGGTRMKGDQGNTPEKDALQPGDATTRKIPRQGFFGQERLESLKAYWETTSEKISHLIDAALFARPIFGAREARSPKDNRAATCEQQPAPKIHRPFL